MVSPLMRPSKCMLGMAGGVVSVLKFISWFEVGFYI